MKPEGNPNAKDLQPLTEGEVRVVTGPNAGQSRPLGGKAVVVGSGPDCDWVLKDSKVSRRHLELKVDSQGFQASDLNSRHGTWFDGARINTAVVPSGALLRLGDTVLALHGRRVGSVAAPHADSFGLLVGQSPAMQRAYSMLETACRTDATVLLGGETGTGKELAARSIHQLGSRARGPFEIFDCAAVSRSLLQSELFGHVKGAFTGAQKDRPGVFERASGGTVFIDEIAELPLELQPALLRLCDRKQTVRVGSTEVIQADVRIIAATRRDLAQEVLAGRFRQDLYYRLQVLPITLPPLRARLDDLPMLCRQMLAELGVEGAKELSTLALAPLFMHAWPGNVRELRNVVERAVTLAGPDVPVHALTFTVAGHDNPVPTFSARTFQSQKKEAMAQFERQYFKGLLKAHAGNVRAVSRASGIERSQLRRMLKRLGLG